VTRYYANNIVGHLQVILAETTCEAKVFSMWTQESTICVELEQYLQIQDPEDANVLEEDDKYLFYPVQISNEKGTSHQAFTMYKRVDKKVKPVSTTFSPDYTVQQCIPEDPSEMLPELPVNPPPFTPGNQLTMDRLKQLEINPDGFLSADKEKLFTHYTYQRGSHSI
jgi:deoxyribodipyrimidine photolyase